MHTDIYSYLVEICIQKATQTVFIKKKKKVDLNFPSEFHSGWNKGCVFRPKHLTTIYPNKCILICGFGDRDSRGAFHRLIMNWSLKREKNIHVHERNGTSPWEMTVVSLQFDSWCPHSPSLKYSFHFKCHLRCAASQWKVSINVSASRSSMSLHSFTVWDAHVPSCNGLMGWRPLTYTV